MKTVLFGGSFDPVHLGHQKIVNEIIKTQLVDDLWILPCGKHAKKNIQAPLINRLEMLNLVFSNQNSVKVKLYCANPKKIIYTSDTIKKLSNRYNNYFYFAIGADQLININSWHCADLIKKEIEFFVITRNNYLSYPEDLRIKKILSINSEISSSMIRQRLNNRDSINGFVDEKVYEYIKEKKLYIIH